MQREDCPGLRRAWLWGLVQRWNHATLNASRPEGAGQGRSKSTKGANAARLFNQAVCRAITVAYAHKPNKSFNADANISHGFAIFMANVGALRPFGLRRRLTRALGAHRNQHDLTNRKILPYMVDICICSHAVINCRWSWRRNNVASTTYCRNW